jgi:hypothetical protein
MLGPFKNKTVAKVTDSSESEVSSSSDSSSSSSSESKSSESSESSVESPIVNKVKQFAAKTQVVKPVQPSQ